MPLANAARSLLNLPIGGSEPSHEQQHQALGERIKRILPSRREEKGWTARHHGFWEQRDSGSDERPERFRRLSSSAIIDWNEPKSLPKVPPACLPPDATKRILLEKTCLRAAGKSEMTSRMFPRIHRKPLPPTCLGREVSEEQARSASTATVITHRQPHATGQAIEVRKRVRVQKRLRASSGDYLGVQGSNPWTGQADVLESSESYYISLGGTTIDAGSPSSRDDLATRVTGAYPRHQDAREAKEGNARCDLSGSWTRVNKPLLMTLYIIWVWVTLTVSCLGIFCTLLVAWIARAGWYLACLARTAARQPSERIGP